MYGTLCHVFTCVVIRRKFINHQVGCLSQFCLEDDPAKYSPTTCGIYLLEKLSEKYSELNAKIEPSKGKHWVEALPWPFARPNNTVFEFITRATVTKLLLVDKYQVHATTVENTPNPNVFFEVPATITIKHRRILSCQVENMPQTRTQSRSQLRPRTFSVKLLKYWSARGRLWMP